MPISSRLGVSAVLLATAGCHPASQPGGNQALAAAEAQQRAQAEDDGLVLCARGDAALTRSCTVEQAPSPAGLVLTIHQPDGGFHRLIATRDGRGVVAADGAEPARVTVAGPDLIDIRLGDDRYRLPATVKR